LAISNDCAEATCNAVLIARSENIFTSFDCNFRPALWHGRTEEAKEHMSNCLKHSEIAFITEKDIQLILNLPANELSNKQTRLEAYSILFKNFPNITKLASTFREYDAQGCLSYQGILVDRNTHYLSNTYHIPYTIDRIGTGDAFAAGIIYGIKNDVEEQQVVEFATALASAKHSIEGDYAALDKLTVIDTMNQDCFNVKR
jgi:2-dehydro-3-deoxygluconokinase